VLCALATLGDTAAQLGPHGRACLHVGNSKTVVVAALVHCFPHIGFPRSVAAVARSRTLSNQPAMHLSERSISSGPVVHGLRPNPMPKPPPTGSPPAPHSRRRGRSDRRPYRGTQLLEYTFGVVMRH